MGKKGSTEEFILASKNKYGKNIFDYSRVEYINSKTKIQLRCLKCNTIFLILPRSHLRNEINECIECYQLKNKTNIFIEKAIKIHGNKYDYSKVIYINHTKKVKIICKEHNIEFEQLCSSHLKSEGWCEKCISQNRTINRNLTLNEFIKKANKVYNNLYDYSKSIYINISTELIVICKIHKEFKIKPSIHLRHSGCPKCSKVRTITTEEFIEKAIQYYGEGIYDYSKVIYTKASNKVIITCLKHNEEFEQEARFHLKRNGCPKCDTNHRLTNKIFIEKAIKKHGDLYDYSKVNYIQAHEDIIIICKEHGEFIQSGTNHLRGKGCNKCRGHNFSKVSVEWLEYVAIKENILIQHIGNSCNEYKILNTNWRTDGYCKETNTVYEFHGDFWHGNPEIYKSDVINNVNNKTMGELYNSTIERENKIKELGYNLVVIWESEWKLFKKMNNLEL